MLARNILKSTRKPLLTPIAKYFSGQEPQGATPPQGQEQTPRVIELGELEKIAEPIGKQLYPETMLVTALTQDLITHAIDPKNPHEKGSEQYMEFIFRTSFNP